MRRRNSRQRGVHFRQAVRSAKCNPRGTARVKPEAVRVVWVIGQKDGNENRRVEERLHLKGSEDGEFPLAADHIQRVIDNRRRDWLASSQHRDAVFLL